MPDHVQLDLIDADVVLDLADAEVVLEVIGEVGPRGPAGAAGTSSGFYRHHQTSASAQWLVQHDLQYPPSVTVVDSAGSVIYADIVYIDDFNIQIDFSTPTAGYAYCT